MELQLPKPIELAPALSRWIGTEFEQDRAIDVLATSDPQIGPQKSAIFDGSRVKRGRFRLCANFTRSDDEKQP
jgi:hypothetical protein